MLEGRENMLRKLLILAAFGIIQDGRALITMLGLKPDKTAFEQTSFDECWVAIVKLELLVNMLNLTSSEEQKRVILSIIRELVDFLINSKNLPQAMSVENKIIALANAIKDVNLELSRLDDPFSQSEQTILKKAIIDEILIKITKYCLTLRSEWIESNANSYDPKEIEFYNTITEESETNNEIDV